MPENIYLLLSFSISFLIVFFAIPKIITVSNHKKLFDVPNHRSASQEHVIPNLGGIAIFSGIYISTLISLEGFDINIIVGVLLSSVILFLMGLKDDTMGLSAGKKITGQLFIAIYLITVCNIRFTNLHGILGLYEINYSLSFLISLTTIIGIINAFNLIDGIDGLAAGIGTLISSAYGFLFLYFGQLEYAILSFSITGALVAFFFFNVFGKTNKIFMGDTGSLTLGGLFAISTIWFNEMIPTQGLSNLEWSLPAVSLAIMIVPVVDSIRIISIRLSQGRSPFSPDMNHIHHELIKITGNHLHASIIMVISNLGLLFITFGLIHMLGNTVMFLVLLAIGFSAAYIPVLINKTNQRKIERAKIAVLKETSPMHLIKSKKELVFSDGTDMEQDTQPSGQKQSTFNKTQSR